MKSAVIGLLFAGSLVVPPTSAAASSDTAPPAGPGNTGPTSTSFNPADGSVFAKGGTLAAPLVITNRRFGSFVEIIASNIIVRDSVFDGGLGIASNTNVTIETSEIRNGMYLASSWNSTVRATEIYGDGDLVHVTSDRGTRMVKNAVFDTVWAHSDSQVSQLPDHVDGVQVRGLDGLTIQNSYFELNTFQDSDNGAFFTQTANGGHSNIRLDNSWFNGGGFAFRYEGDTGGYFEVMNCSFPNGYKWGVQYEPKRGSSPTAQRGNKYQRKDGTWAPLTLL
jgi:hypothetical protein